MLLWIDGASVYVVGYQRFLRDGGPNCDYDCFIVNLREHLPIEEIALLANLVARTPSGWVEVFGHAAERIHDAIDNAAVAVGRQSKVGDGNPMTTWDEDDSIAECARWIAMGGQGTNDVKVVVVIGSAADERDLYDNIRTAA